MSVLVVTSLGDIVIDLYADRCPLTCKNFLKLCKIKYYNGCLFHTVQKDFTAQTGDPTGTGSGGDSIYRFLYGDQARFFSDEIQLDLKHVKKGTIAMASAGENLNASQFYITLRDGLDYLDGKHTVFGEIAEGLDTLERINEAYVDDKGRPYKNIRIKHTYILDDPFDDPSQLSGLVPDASPEGIPKEEVQDDVRLEDDWVPMDEQLNPEELEEVIREKEAYSRAVVLETLQDIPDAEIKPPENVLFVCKLNPVTEDEDLHTIFSRFGTVTSADIIRDFKTGDSLCYAFIEFEDEEACIEAYKKMDNALIDDRRIKVDFSQSVAKLWNNYRRKGSKDGSGCFKCGSLDHVAKDCTGGSNTRQQQNYVLKDENPQRGGKNDASYDMVFDEDDDGSPKREKGHRKHGLEDDRHRRKTDYVKKDSYNDSHRSRRVHRDDYRERREDRESRRKDESHYQLKRRGETESGMDHGDNDRGLRKRSLEHNDGQYEKDRDDGYRRRKADDADDGHRRRKADDTDDGHRRRKADDEVRRKRERDRDHDSSDSRSRKGERDRRRSPDARSYRDRRLNGVS